MVQGKINIPISLYEAALKGGWERALSFYLLLHNRTARSKRVFYKFNHKDLSKLMGVSENTSRKYVKELLSIGLLRISCGNLMLVARNRFYTDKRGWMHVKIVDSFKNQVHVVIGANILRNIRRQEHRIAKKAAIVSKHNTNGRLTIKEIKLIREHGGIAGFEGSVCSRTHLSNDKISEAINMSIASARRYKKRLRQHGVISVEPHYEDVVKSDLRGYYEFLEGRQGLGYLYSSKRGMIIKRYSDYITIKG